MRRAFALALTTPFLIGAPAMAESAWTVATPYEERRPFDTAADAEAYADRLCSAVYGEREETARQRPFHAADAGGVWRVVGSRPYGWPLKVDPASPAWPVTGPITIVIEKATGRVTDVHFTFAPAGWDADILRNIGRAPDPAGSKQ